MIFPKVDEPPTVGFMREIRRLRKGKQDEMTFLYNGGTLEVFGTDAGPYGKPTKFLVKGTDSESYTVLATLKINRRGTGNIWHDLKKLADPSYDHPFSTGMGADVEHPFHEPGPKVLAIN